MLALWLVGGAAQAQPLDSVSREAATALGVAGLEAYEAGSYEEALDKLEKSYAVARVPTLGLWTARTLQKLGRWLEAEARYTEAIALPVPEGDRDTQQQALAEAQAELATLTQQIPAVRIELEGARREEVQLRIDGKPVAPGEAVHRVDPGTHHVEGVKGNAHEAIDLRVAARERRTVFLRFAPAQAASAGGAAEQDEASNWLRTAGWTAVVASGASLALGTVAVVLALQKKNEIDDNPQCRSNACAPSEQGLVDSYDTRRTLSTVGFIAGGAFGVLGLSALLASSGDGAEDPRAEAVVSPGFTGIRGSF